AAADHRAGRSPTRRLSADDRCAAALASGGRARPVHGRELRGHVPGARRRDGPALLPDEREVAGALRAAVHALPRGAGGRRGGAPERGADRVRPSRTGARSFLMSETWLERFAPLFTRFPEVPVFVGAEPLIEQLTGFHLHRGALAAMQRPVLPSAAELLRDAQGAGARDHADHAEAGHATARAEGPQAPRGSGRSRIAILEDLVDHTNVGACFRSAAAMGVDAVLVTPRCADPLYRRSIRVSMGTVFQ